MSSIWAKFDVGLTAPLIWGGSPNTDIKDGSRALASFNGQEYIAEVATYIPASPNTYVPTDETLYNGAMSASVTGGGSVNDDFIFTVGSFVGGVTDSPLLLDDPDYNSGIYFAQNDSELPNVIAQQDLFNPFNPYLAMGIGLTLNYFDEFLVLPSGQSPMSEPGYTDPTQTVEFTIDLPNGAESGEVTVPSFVWVQLGAPSNLEVSPTSQDEYIVLVLDSAGDVVNTPSHGVISFADSDPTTRPFGALLPQSVSATGRDGKSITLSAAEISALESVFTFSPAAGNTDDGSLDWTFDPDGAALGLLTPQETAACRLAHSRERPGRQFADGDHNHRCHGRDFASFYDRRRHGRFQ